MPSTKKLQSLKPTTLLILLCTAIFARTQQPSQDLTLRGTITHANHQTYVELPFNVPADTARITVDFTYTGRDQRTTIDLGLSDPERFRGWSGGNKSSFTVSESDATPSYLPGPIRPGTWKLILGVPNIREGVTSTYEAHIHLARASDRPAVSTFSATPIRPGPAWFRGDLHMHDAHSDGSCLSQSGTKVPCPLYKTIEAASKRNLDFIAITDHNTTSHFNSMQELQPYFDHILLIPGREITTFQGHANVFGPTAFIDFRLTSPTVPDFNHLLDQVAALHGLISINHPGQPSGESCMGCGWTVPNVDYARVNAIEAINGGNAETPIAGIPFWTARLNQGFHLTAIAGSDNHDSTLTPPAGSAIGHPTTVVYAADLSENSILDAIRAGHVFIDVEGSPNRALEFTADNIKQTANAPTIMGDTISPRPNQPVHFTVKMSNLEGAHPEIIEDGQPTTLLDPLPIAQETETRTFTLTPDTKPHWLRVNIRSQTNTLLLVGNPIYINAR